MAHLRRARVAVRSPHACDLTTAGECRSLESRREAMGRIGASSQTGRGRYRLSLGLGHGPSLERDDRHARKKPRGSSKEDC
jgi:hypothetical protein